jgi:hypothetical protein
MESIFDLEVKEKKAQKDLYRAKTNGRRKSGHMLPIDFMSAEERKEYTKAGEITVTSLWDQILSRSQYDELTEEKKKQALTHWRKIHTTKAIKEKLGWNDYHLYKEFEKLGIEVEKRAPRGTSARHKAKMEKQGKGKSVAITAAAPKMSLLEFADTEENNQPYDPFSALDRQPDQRFQNEIQALAAKMADATTTKEDKMELLIYEFENMIGNVQEKLSRFQAAAEKPQGALFALNETLDAATLATKLMKYASFLEDEPHKFKIRLEIEELKE